MSLSPDLLKAYHATRYVIDNGAATFHIGTRSALGDRLLAGFGARDAVLITAWNPGSKWRPTLQNRGAAKRLENLVRRLGYPMLRAIAIGDDPAWTEEGIFIPGMGTRQGLDLARRFRQLAIVTIKRHHPVKLLERFPLRRKRLIPDPVDRNRSTECPQPPGADLRPLGSSASLRGAQCACRIPMS